MRHLRKIRAKRLDGTLIEMLFEDCADTLNSNTWVSTFLFDLDDGYCAYSLVPKGEIGTACSRRLEADNQCLIDNGVDPGSVDEALEDPVMEYYVA